MLKNILTILGSFIFFHAAYTYREYKNELLAQEIEKPITPTPQVILELVIGFFLILIGQLSHLKLKDIRIAPNIRNKSFEEVISRNEFSTFNHRGNALAQRLAK